MSINSEFLLLISAVFLSNSMPSWMALVFGWIFLVWAWWRSRRGA